MTSWAAKQHLLGKEKRISQEKHTDAGGVFLTMLQGHSEEE